MKHLLEQLFRVLFHGDVHLHLERNRAPISVVLIRIVLGCALSETTRFSLTIDLLEDRDETRPFVLKSPLESLHCCRRQLPDHTPPRFGARR